jgi:predicted dienelactone hydrolase
MCGDGQVRGQSKYEEMGPLAVTSFQTSHPELVYVIQCNPQVVPIAPSPPDAEYQKPPTRLFVVVPSSAGRYPVLLFKHGFSLANCAYSSILRHVASYGYVVVAPQVIDRNSCAMLL